LIKAPFFTDGAFDVLWPWEQEEGIIILQNIYSQAARLDSVSPLT
jgi:hypothetical protein